MHKSAYKYIPLFGDKCYKHAKTEYELTKYIHKNHLQEYTGKINKVLRTT